MQGRITSWRRYATSGTLAVVAGCWIGCSSGTRNTTPDSPACQGGNACGGYFTSGDSPQWIVADANTLYDSCGNAVRACPGACDPVPDGNFNEHCEPCPRGDGLYCGGDGIVGDPHALYTCTTDYIGADVSVAQVCPLACQVVAGSRTDTCA